MSHWIHRLPDTPNALNYAGAIHRYVEPPQWLAELEKVPTEHREFVEIYLRGMAARIRVIRAIRKQKEAERAR